MRSDGLLKSPWFILFIVLLTSIAAPLNQFKVPPVMPLLMKAFSQSAGRAGLLMSFFAFTGLILSIPAGLIFSKLGYRITGLLAILAILAGALLGVFSKSIETILASRFIEGAGMSLMSVVAPAIIALWFSVDKRGKAMGIWAVWVPLGSTIMFILAPLLAVHGSWQAVWWFGFFYTGAAGLLFYLFIGSSSRPSSARRRQASPMGQMKRGLGIVLRNRNLWLISFLFCCFNFVYVAFVSWAPTFLHQLRGASIARASLLVSVTTILTIIACPLGGWISDRVGSRKAICVIPLVLMAFLFPLNSGADENLFLALAMGVGFCGGFVPGAVFAAGAEVVEDERLAGMAMAVIQIGQNSGMLLGPLVFGWVVESWDGWAIAFWVLAPVSILGAVAGLMAKMR